MFHLPRLEWLVAYELPNTGLNAIETAQDHDRSLDPCSSPACDGFEVAQDLIESLAQVGNDMIGVTR